VAVGGEGRAAVGAVDGEVEVGVGLGEGWGHGEGVVEVGEGGAGGEEGLSGVEDGLGVLVDAGALGRGGPAESYELVRGCLMACVCTQWTPQL
jgi:hypothetical protein